MGGKFSKNAPKIVQESARTVLARRQAPEVASNVAVNSAVNPTNTINPSHTTEKKNVDAERVVPVENQTATAPTFPRPPTPPSSAQYSERTENMEMRGDILEQISKWQVDSQVQKVTPQPLVESAGNIRRQAMRIMREKKMTPLGSPKGKLTEEHLHYLFKELRDNPNISREELASKYYLTPQIIETLIAVVHFPHLVPDPDEPGINIAVTPPIVKDR